MRRMLPGSKFFWTGFLVLPVMAATILGVSQRSDGDVKFVPVTRYTSNGPVTEMRAVEYQPGQLNVFQARVDMLAGETPDAAEAEKTAQLREKLRTVIDEKAALLNSAALEAEIAGHQRQIAELKAQQELRQLQRGLQELSDKFPDSDAGRQAAELLNILRQRAAAGAPPPVYSPMDNGNPGTPAPAWRSDANPRPAPFVPYEAPKTRRNPSDPTY